MTGALSSSLHNTHAPVMLHEVLAALNPQDGERYVDGTFGAGGYTTATLEAVTCNVYAIDRDPEAVRFAGALKERFADRFVFIPGTFGQMMELLARQGVESVDGVMLDVGVSSMQLDQAVRGFSFRQDGPLDMRMAQAGVSAADVVNTAPESTLADIIYYYGEEKAARRIAKAIVKAREEAPIETTLQLSRIVASVLGRGQGKIDPATRTFQALRIHVNDELGELVRALEAAEHVLAPGGRLVVVTFHSLEDRIVKRFFQSRTGAVRDAVSRHVPQSSDKQNVQASFEQPQRRAVKASDKESRVNPRARSAKLRWAVRTTAPVMAEPFMTEGEVRYAVL